MYIAHGPISYILNETIQKKDISKLSKQEHLLVMILSILFGMLPDIDLAILSFTNIPPFQHHLIFTHSILFYISLWLILNIIFKILKKLLNKESRKALNDHLLNIIQKAFLIGTLSHIFADILLSYSRSLFPLEKQITIFGDIFKTNYFASYVYTPQFATEILFVAIFLFLVFRKYFKNVQLVKYFIYLFIFLSSMYLPFTMYMNLNTYNKAYHFKNGQIVLDMDMDGVHDRHDSDTTNSGKNNILEIDRGEMVKFVKGISNGKYLVASNDDFLNITKKKFGAMTSYRLISQAFFEQNLPIEPVLREYYKDKHNLEGYSIDIDYEKAFYEYLTENRTPSQTENMNTVGSIFFVLDTEGNILNMGIMLEENMVGTVLLGDTRLVTHTKDSITKNMQIWHLD